MKECKNTCCNTMGEQIVSELITTVKSVMYNNEAIRKIVKTILDDVGIEPTTVLRRDHDGVSEASWLVEKMIGEYLKDQRPRF